MIAKKCVNVCERPLLGYGDGCPSSVTGDHHLAAHNPLDLSHSSQHTKNYSSQGALRTSPARSRSMVSAVSLRGGFLKRSNPDTEMLGLGI